MARSSRRRRAMAAQAVRVTHTPGPESQVTWAPDSTHIAYLSQRDAITHVFLYDFAKHAETQLTHDAAMPDQGPRFSPDGKIDRLRARSQGTARGGSGFETGATSLVSGFIGGGFRTGRLHLVARQQVDRLCATRAAGSLRNVYVVQASRRAAAADQLSGEHQRQFDPVESRTANSCCMKPASAPRLRRWRASI